MKKIPNCITSTFKNILELEKINDCKYKLQTKKTKVNLGLFIQDVDGYFYWWDNKENYGCISSYSLRCIVELLEELNKPWDDKINKYFESQVEDNNPGTG